MSTSQSRRFDAVVALLRATESDYNAAMSKPHSIGSVDGTTDRALGSCVRALAALATDTNWPTAALAITEARADWVGLELLRLALVGLEVEP